MENFFIPDLTLKKVQVAVQRGLAIYLKLPQDRFNPDGRKGGFFAIKSRFGGHLFLLTPFGEIVPIENVLRYTHFAAVVKPEMLRYAPEHSTSGQNQCAALNYWAGAIAIKPDSDKFTGLVVLLGMVHNRPDELVFAFSGLTAKGDEGVVIVAALLLELITLKKARELAGLTKNEVADLMIDAVINA